MSPALEGLPDSGHDNMSGEPAPWTQTEWYQARLADFDAAMERQSKPRPALEIVRADLAGTIKGVIYIICAGVLMMAASALLEGVRL